MKIFGKTIVSISLAAIIAGAILSAGCEDSKKKISAEKPVPVAAPAPPLPATAYTTLDNVPPEVVFKSFPQTRLPENDSIKQTVGKYLVDGMKFQAKGKIDEALRQYESARMYAPDSPRVLRALGMIWMAKREYEKAANYFRMSLDVEPDDLQGQISLGRTYLMLNRPEDALYCFRAALKTRQAKTDNVETAYAVLYRSRLLEKLGYFTASLQSYDYLETLVRQNWSTYQNDSIIGDFILKPERFMIARGNLYDQLREPAKALAEYNKALSRDRNAVKVGIKVFELYVQTCDFKNAEKLLEEFATQEDYSSYLGKLAVILCEKTRDENQPLRLWKIYRRRNTMSTAFAFALADAADTIKAWSQEKAILTDILNTMPDAPQAATRLAELAVKTGHPEDCMEQMAELIVNNTKAFDNVTAAMEVLAKQENAAAMLDQYAAMPPAGNVSVQAGRSYVAAILAMKLDQADRSDKLLELAIKTDPKFAPGYVSLLQPQWILSNPQATDAYVRQMKGNITGPDYYYVLGNVDMARGNYVQAIANLKKARELDESSEPIAMKLSQAYELEARKTTDPNKAARYNQDNEDMLETAIELRPDKLEAYQQLFQKSLNRLDTRKAAEIAIRVMRNAPQSPEGRIMAAETYLIANNRSRAKIIIDDLVKHCPEDPRVKLLQIRFDLGEHAGLISKKSFDTNYAALKRLISNNPDFAPAYELAGRLLGMPMPADYAEAVKYLAKASALDVDNFTYSREYVMGLMRAGDYKTALSLAQTLYGQSPRSVTLKQTIISCLEELGDFKKALEYLSQWHDAMPENRTYIDWMLRMYVSQNDYDKAFSLLDKLGNMTNTASYPPAWINNKKFELCMSQKNFTKAFDLVKDSQAPDNMRNVVILIDAMADARQYDKALEFVDRMRKSITHEEEVEQAAETQKAKEDKDTARATTTQKADGPMTNDEAPATQESSDAKEKAEVEKIEEAQEVGETETIETPQTPAESKEPEMDEETRVFLDRVKALRYYILSRADRMNEFMADLAKEKPTPTLCSNVYAALMSGRHFEEAVTLLKKWQVKESFSPDDKVKTEINSWCNEMIVATYMAMFDYDKASSALQDCLATDGDKSWYYYYSANIAIHKGDYEDSVLMLQKALQQDPKNATLKNDLAYQLAVIGKDLKNAEKLSRECLQEKGFLPAYMDTLAWVFYKASQPGRAADLLMKVVPSAARINTFLAQAKKLNTPISAEDVNPIIVDHLGDVLDALGWDDIAKQYWQAAYDLARQWPVQTDEMEQVMKSTSEKLKKKNGK